MSAVAQKVVVIDYASRKVNLSAIKWALDALRLKPGDSLTLLGVLHQVNTPMGFKFTVNSSFMFGANEKIVKEEFDRKKEEYNNSQEILEIRELYKMRKIDFDISVVVSSSPKVDVLEAAMRLRATWIILDRFVKNNGEKLYKLNSIF